MQTEEERETKRAEVGGKRRLPSKREPVREPTLLHHRHHHHHHLTLPLCFLCRNRSPPTSSSEASRDSESRSA